MSKGDLKKPKKNRASLPEILTLESLGHKTRRSEPGHLAIEMGRVPEESGNYVYVNKGYAGSVNSVSERSVPVEPPTTVVREQYWACSKWPRAQQFLAIAVGVLVGAVIGLALSFYFKIPKEDTIIGFFRSPTQE